VSSLIGNTYKRNLANIDVGGSQWPLLALVKYKKKASGSFPILEGIGHPKMLHRGKRVIRVWKDTNYDIIEFLGEKLN